MLLDDALRVTLRNFSTLFLVIFIVLGPLHLVYAFVFHDVLALRELHPAIADFPANRQVRGVGRDALAQARIWSWVVAVVGLALTPLFLRVGSHVIAMDERDEVPTASEAWRRARAQAATERSGYRIGTIAAGVAIGVAIALLTQETLMVVSDLVPDSAAFGVIALAQSVGRSAGGAFVVGTFLAAGRTGVEGPREVSL